MKISESAFTKGYEPFDQFIFRIPVFHSGHQRDYEDLLSDNIFKEALYLASKPLYNKTLLYKDEKFSALPDKIKRSIFKYFMRMTSRSTPFGLFAGCGIGKIDTISAVRLPEKEAFVSRTKVNMSFLSLLSDMINSSFDFESGVLYYPNTTLFKTHKFYRYIETKAKEAGFEYLMSELGASSYLEKILQAAIKGISRPELVDLLMREEEVEYEDAKEFVEELIQNHVLVSEFGIYMTKEDNLAYFIERLSRLKDCKEQTLLPFLLELRDQLRQIDVAPIGDKLGHFEALSDIIRQRIGEREEEDYLRLNLCAQPLTASLSKDLVGLVKKGLHVLNLLTAPPAGTLLQDFKDKFYQRYEHEEVPLVEALDPDIGVSRGNFSPSGFGPNALISGIFTEQTITKRSKSLLGRPLVINSFIHDKYLICLDKQEDIIYISEEELTAYTANWDDLPPTLSVGVEVLKTVEGPGPVVLIKYAGGLSAINTLSRFSDLSPAFRQYAEQIVAIEEGRLSENTIIADLVYKVEDQGIANVMQRPPLREYEIPIMSLPSGDAVVIPASDIMISLTQDHKMMLRSASLDKFIIPSNSTAHNFTFKTSPLYYFLSAYQATGNIRGASLFSWGQLEPKDGHFPRVVYENTIVLSAARWKISAGDLNPGKDFTAQLKALITQRKIPHKIYLVSSIENKVMLDLDCEETFGFLKMEMKKGQLLLEECLLDEQDAFVTREGKLYNHEVIISFFKSASL